MMSVLAIGYVWWGELSTILYFYIHCEIQKIILISSIGWSNLLQKLGWKCQIETNRILMSPVLFCQAFLSKDQEVCRMGEDQILMSFHKVRICGAEDHWLFPTAYSRLVTKVTTNSSILLRDLLQMQRFFRWATHFFLKGPLYSPPPLIFPLQIDNESKPSKQTQSTPQRKKWPTMMKRWLRLKGSSSASTPTVMGRSRCRSWPMSCASLDRSLLMRSNGWCLRSTLIMMGALILRNLLHFIRPTGASWRMSPKYCDFFLEWLILFLFLPIWGPHEWCLALVFGIKPTDLLLFWLIISMYP